MLLSFKVLTFVMRTDGSRKEAYNFEQIIDALEMIQKKLHATVKNSSPALWTLLLLPASQKCIAYF